MAEMNENAEKMNFHAEENREETAFDEVEAELGLALLYAFRECYPKEFAFLPPLKEGSRRSIELLFGNDRILDENVSFESLLEEYHKDSREFYERKKKFHLYD